jgi:AbiTii
MATLLQEIQRDAANDAVSLTSLLRKCQILAGRLRADEFAAWAKRELAGYGPSDPLPPYRARMRGRVIGNVANLAYRHTNASLGETMIPEEYRDEFLNMDLLQPVADLQDLVSAAVQPVRPLPPEMYPLMSRHLDGGYQVTSAHVEYSRAALVAVLDGIRTRALEFALQIEALNPDAGESSPAGEPPIPAADVRGAFSNTIYAQSINFAQASSGVSQVITVGTVNVRQGDLPSLLRYLEEVGVDAGDREALAEAIAADHGEADRPGHRVREWLGRMAFKAAAAGEAIGENTIGGLIATAVAKFLGLI